LRSGLFIVLEGVEGAGKSTQARLLDEWLDGLGLPHTLAREPGGTPVGEAIRRVVLDRGDLTMPPETELFLILGARAAFTRDVVRPALERGEVVIADRYDLSTFAYQGFGRGLELEAVRRANEMATGGLRPDLYLVLDLPAEEGLKRKGGSGSGDRIEREGIAFLSRVRDGYRRLAEEVIEARMLRAEGTAAQVQASIRQSLCELFPETFCHD
jgi:dTMP kinase